MIAGLDDLLALTGQPGLPELRASMAELLGEPEAQGRVVVEQRLNRSGSVNRVRFEVQGALVSVVAKCSRPAPAQRNKFVVRRCLPAVGLESGAPAILATAPERGGRCVWQIYEDLGDRTLETDRDPEAVRAAVQLLGEVHARFVRHPLLAEVRHRGGEFGRRFYSSSVQDAIACLEALAHRHLDWPSDGIAPTERLLERLRALQAEDRQRTEVIADLGGPETFLHGDMWLKNVAVAARGARVRLIDWDHAGVGPAGYDLSTFVNGFSPEERDGVLELYGEAVAAAGWQLPSREEMDYLFSTFELGRLANCVIWPALDAIEGVEGALEELEMACDWFGSLDAALPTS